jgi:hypothetical protein
MKDGFVALSAQHLVHEGVLDNMSSAKHPGWRNCGVSSKLVGRRLGPYNR